jgi:hypothetical protein
MESGTLATFRSYLRSLPCELLESVSEDYVWLSGLAFEGERTEEFRGRRECCREECLRRGVPHLYRMAEQVVSPWAA